MKDGLAVSFHKINRGKTHGSGRRFGLVRSKNWTAIRNLIACVRGHLNNSQIVHTDCWQPGVLHVLQLPIFPGISKHPACQSNRGVQGTALAWERLHITFSRTKQRRHHCTRTMKNHRTSSSAGARSCSLLAGAFLGQDVPWFLGHVTPKSSLQS
ncbi:uncharacterized protein BDCG_05108 [Blastomyces dermatitidis ER-3]|uniref:Uncharacterized protein n=2 Tax=Blastomyces TaxID=229219 RepID=A0A179V0J4_BLAGS|nr:uncharacterized protein BDBG_08263 [Blastomyces gilchristii SLH14081]XP_045276808.1 uncharacterized protein BDCG_05108 [Blastomyces dermatitidis ER-3]EEQ89988.1 hypothetical protein BDCG_05108 [Blastomyces dermatitidis ER-3]OAT12989.1 hypothetical protein BDBG_08263 [Blastomyces gilchristii SLH14081]